MQLSREDNFLINCYISLLLLSHF